MVVNEFIFKPTEFGLPMKYLLSIFNGQMEVWIQPFITEMLSVSWRCSLILELDPSIGSNKIAEKWIHRYRAQKSGEEIVL